jgi:hypothetical protein
MPHSLAQGQGSGPKLANQNFLEVFTIKLGERKHCHLFSHSGDTMG